MSADLFVLYFGLNAMPNKAVIIITTEIVRSILKRCGFFHSCHTNKIVNASMTTAINQNGNSGSNPILIAQFRNALQKLEVQVMRNVALRMGGHRVGG